MGLTVVARSWHTPYMHMLARALPDFEFKLLPSTHAPRGWRDDQRPMPGNTRVCPLCSDVGGFDVAILQTARDWMEGSLGLWPRSKPTLYLAHNRPEFEALRILPIQLDAAGVRLVCISEMKRDAWREAGYNRSITVIRPGIDPDDYLKWAYPENPVMSPHVLTVANGLSRPLFDAAKWVTTTQVMPTLLVGEGNDSLPGAVGPASSWGQLRSYYQHATVYFSANHWPEEDAYNLALLEASATGTPVVALPHPRLAELPWVSHGDTRQLLINYLKGEIYHGPNQAAIQRDIVAATFPLEKFAQSWRQVLEETVDAR